LDIEFHYYVNYIIALKAGFTSKKADIIATAAQLVDDNIEINLIENNKGEIYKSYVSQTANILRPKDELFRIYPIFHFVPGDPFCISAQRKDGLMHILNTTPDNENARLLMEEALSSKNLYRIGIASHAYCDTWAHQNFTGYYSYFNGLSGVFEKAIPNIGHADAKHKPDLVSKVWLDERLSSVNEVVDNNRRFIKAASKLLDYYAKFNKKVIKDKAKFLNQLNKIFSIKGNKDYHYEKRIRKYNEISKKLSGNVIKDYKKYEWFESSVDVYHNESIFLPQLNYNEINYKWKDIDYQKSPYYLFCEAIKAHQKVGEDIFKDDKYDHLELNSW